MFNFFNYYFKIFGNPPISLKVVRLNGANYPRWVFSHSMIGDLYNIILNFILFVASITIFYCTNHKTKILSWLKITEIIAGFAVFLILLRFHIQPKDLIPVINQLNNINQYIDVESVVIKTFFNIIFINAFQFLKISIMNIFYREGHSNFFPILRTGFITSTNIFNHLIIRAVFMQCTFMLKLIENCIAFINSEMMNLLDESILEPNNIFLNTSVLSKIQKYMHLHGLLYDLSQKLSNYYSLTLMLSTIYTFFTTIRVLYYFLEILMVTDTFHVPNILQAFLFILPLFWLTTRVTAVTNEVG